MRGGMKGRFVRFAGAADKGMGFYFYSMKLVWNESAFTTSIARVTSV